MNKKYIVIAIVTILIVSGAAGVLLLNQKNNPGGYVPNIELEVFGNANKDWKIDENDLTALEEIIAGERESTAMADANNDGVIDELDLEQVKAIINRTAEFIWLIDGDGNTKKIKLDIERIGSEYYSNTELMCILNVKDKVVAVDNAPYQLRDFYFREGGTDIVNMENMNAPNYEAVAGLDLDILLTFSYAGTEAKQEALSNVDVIYLGMYRPNVLEPEKSEYMQAILKAGYIFDRVERAENYINWLLEVRNDIASISKTIAEEDKVNVLMTNYSNSHFADENIVEWSLYTKIDPQGQALLLAGGHSVAQDILTPQQYNGGPDRTIYSAKVGSEAIITTDIDYIFCHCVRFTYGGAELTSTPNHGYGISDKTEIDAAQALAASRTMMDFVDDDNIYIMAGDFRNGATGGILHAAYIAKAIYPDLFLELDPVAIHNQYVNEWLGVSDYDVSVDGVFISPIF
ncbi:MAG: ABC transporter substrate-binding protein [Candidatus Methanomethylophilaceae archaeon]|jgi:iron complex transport system substrate-binding protein